MNRRPDLPPALATVDLAREEDFAIGGLQVCPSRRQVIAGDRQETVQPRVMQVLVALVRAKGAVLSREDLIESCWEGITVGDDAINRCIAKVRQISELGGSHAFEIETIPRVGYRLKVHAGDAPRVPPGVAPSATEIAKPATALTSRNWTLIGAVGLVLLLGAIAAGWWLRPTSPLKWTVVRSEMPIATSLIERHPAISQDGTMIAYSAGTDVLGRHIYLKRISGGDPLRLTNDPYDDASPSWSPDGGQIAYVAYKGSEPCRLMLVPALAGSPREVTRCHTDERSQVVWAVDSKHLYFIDRAAPSSHDRIMRLDLETGLRTQLTHPQPSAGDEEGIAASPDGSWLTFSRDISESATQRMLLNLATGAERVLIPNDYSGPGAWSDDSQSVFTVDAENGNFSIWSHPIDGRPAQHIFSSPDELSRLNSGPNGLLAVEINRVTSGVARTYFGATPNSTVLESENGSAYALDVARDGSIAVALARPDGAGIWLLPKHGAMRKLIDIDSGVAEHSRPRWSPDGTRIAFVWLDDILRIRVVSTNGAVVATIPFAGKSISPPVWTPDGRSLIFPGEDVHGWRLWQVNLDHPGHVAPLTYRGWSYIRNRGSELYGVRTNAHGVWRIDGGPRQIVRASLMSNSQWTNDSHWAISDSSILYWEPATGRLWAQPIVGGPARAVALVHDFFWSGGFAVDDASNSIVYSSTLNPNAGDIELLHLARE